MTNELEKGGGSGESRWRSTRRELPEERELRGIKREEPRAGNLPRRAPGRISFGISLPFK